MNDVQSCLRLVGATIATLVLVACGGGGGNPAPGAGPIGGGGGGGGGGGTPPPPAVPALSWQTVANGFEALTFLTAPPGDTDRLFVSDRRGRIWIITGGEVRAVPYLDISDRVAQAESDQEWGLFSFAFDPDYADNGYAYVSYSSVTDASDAADPLDQGDSVIARYQVSDDPDVADPSTHTRTFALAQPDAYHNGGMIAFGPDGYLYVGLGDGAHGDGSGDPERNAQNRENLYGSLLRLDVSGGAYTVPGDNPFVGTAGARGEIWAYGLRNPWRFSFDRDTGAVYVADVGQSAQEEINALEAPDAARGANFGWNVTQGTECFDPPQSCDTTGLTAPVLTYEHPAGPGGICSASVSGGYVYRGGDIANLAGTYFYSDYCYSWVRSFRLAGGAATERTEWGELLLDPNHAMSFGEDGRGELYALTSEGIVLRLANAAIGADGGTARSDDDRASVTIPVGALAAAAAITVAPAATSPGEGALAGSVYEFGPAGTTFSTAATMRIRYEELAVPVGVPQDDLRLARWSGTEWALVAGSTVDTARREVSGQVSGFSLWGIAAAPPPGSVALTIQLGTLSGDGVVLITERRTPEDVGLTGCSSQGEEGSTCVRDVDENVTVVLEAFPYADPKPAAVWAGCDTVNGFFCTVLMNGDRTVQVRW